MFTYQEFGPNQVFEPEFWIKDASKRRRLDFKLGLGVTHLIKKHGGPRSVVAVLFLVEHQEIKEDEKNDQRKI